MKNIIRRAERGSALFLILIAVALFAALGYAVSNMMQGGSSTNIGDEQSRLYATEILDYARTMRQTIQAMRIDGCRDTEISFENQVEGGYVNGTDTDCQVFHPDGGGMSYVTPSNQWLDQNASSNDLFGELFFTGASCVNGVGSSNAGTTCRDFTSNYAELVFVIPYLDEDLCYQIADIAEVLQNNTIPVENQRAWPDANPKFNGIFDSENVIANNSGADSSESLDGKFYGCFEGGGLNPPSSTYHFYQVLVSR